MAAGIRIILNMQRCRRCITGPVIIEEMFLKALSSTDLEVLRVSVLPFQNGTANFHADLSESHVSGGTYKRERYAGAEISVCHETRVNTESARILARRLIMGFDPEIFDFDNPDHYLELPWQCE